MEADEKFDSPISTQPLTLEMQPPEWPRSIQYLAKVDQLLIRQKIEALQALVPGVDISNKYAVLDKDEQRMFYVEEESNVWQRYFLPLRCRGLKLHVTDNALNLVMMFEREFKCCTGCCWCGDGCCSMTFNVECPPGRRIGSVRTGNSLWKDHMQVFDAAGQHLFTIWGPCCTCQCILGCKDDINFPITDPSLKHRVGNIAKTWSKCCATYRNADNFCLTFPADMTVEGKVLLLGAAFLTEFYVYESQKTNES